jgi:hypothetical protein
MNEMNHDPRKPNPGPEYPPPRYQIEAKDGIKELTAEEFIHICKQKWSGWNGGETL